MLAGHAWSSTLSLGASSNQGVPYESCVPALLLSWAAAVGGGPSLRELVHHSKRGTAEEPATTGAACARQGAALAAAAVIRRRAVLAGKEEDDGGCEIAAQGVDSSSCPPAKMPSRALQMPII